MARKPERRFQDWLKQNMPHIWFRRVENAVGGGDPDVWACSEGHSVWIETKACPKTNVQLRVDQYAWIVKAASMGIGVMVWNRESGKKEVQVWCAPFDKEITRKAHCKISSPPNINLSTDEFKKLTLKEIIELCQTSKKN